MHPLYKSGGPLYRVKIPVKCLQLGMAFRIFPQPAEYRSPSSNSGDKRVSLFNPGTPRTSEQPAGSLQPGPSPFPGYHTKRLEGTQIHDARQADTRYGQRYRSREHTRTGVDRQKRVIRRAHRLGTRKPRPVHTGNATSDKPPETGEQIHAQTRAKRR